ncbi:hypothetical protein HYFRA_00008810 [Hymenoscyphus fraxineus]|uniref:Uncharacterized protein n=1 Tax=Hymenoscyphus fraxineus TaxID=746836 RepID=A0A9N9PQM6_9HELO|nr:hypothetical protein HYFRA_00008810 [Hymenoscyphus fraxineus]
MSDQPNYRAWAHSNDVQRLQRSENVSPAFKRLLSAAISNEIDMSDDTDDLSIFDSLELEGQSGRESERDLVSIARVVSTQNGSGSGRPRGQKKYYLAESASGKFYRTTFFTWNAAKAVFLKPEVKDNFAGEIKWCKYHFSTGVDYLGGSEHNVIEFYSHETTSGSAAYM